MTFTNTGTYTKTITNTYTATNTFTVTNTRTLTPTFTPSNTSINTNTSTPTNTNSGTPTSTPTWTITSTPTNTPSPTPTVQGQYTVRIGVYNEAGELVKTILIQQFTQPILDINLAASNVITSLNGATGKIDILFHGVVIGTWDGTNGSGDPVTNGQYYVKVDNVDNFGVDDSVSKMVMVSRSIAKVQVNIYNEAGEIVRHLYSYADDPGNLSLMDMSLSASVIQPSDTATVASTVQITSSNGMKLIWDGKSDSGAVVTNGHYEVEVKYTDGKGGQEVITKGILVESSNQSLTDGKVYAKPNLLTKGVTKTKITVNSGQPYILFVRLYDVAGELLWTSKPATGSVELDLSGLSSGLYFAVTDLMTAQGGIVNKQVTKIVFQQ